MTHNQQPGNRPLMIAIVTQGYQSSGGVQTVARWLVSNLKANNIDVHIYNLAASSTDARSRRLLEPRSWISRPLIEKDRKEEHLTQVGTKMAEIEPLRYLPQRELTRRLNEYDVVQVVCGGPAIANVAKHIRPPIMIQMATLAKWERESIHASMTLPKRSIRKLATRIVSSIEKSSLRQSHTTMLENSDIYQHLLNQGIKNALIAPPGVDTNLFKPSTEPWQRTKPIIYLGRLGEPRKGIDRIIRSFKLLKESHDAVPNLILAGRGSLPSELRTLISDLRLISNITVVEEVPQDELIPLLQSASVFIQTSYEEGLGIAVLEAMACGLPVVATETAGTKETIIDGKTGFLIPQSNAVEKSAEKTWEALLHGATISPAARSHVVSRFSNEVTANIFIQTYQSAISPKQSAKETNKDPQRTQS